MNFEQSNFSSVQQESEIDLNLTPLIDIIFLLLIFFMLTTTFQDKEALSVNLPKASQGGTIDEDTIKELVITSDGAYHLDNTLVLPENLISTLKLDSPSGLIVRADKVVEHGKVVEVLDAAKQAGIDKISIATQSK